MSKRETAIKLKNVKKSYRQYKSNLQKIRFLLLMRDAGIKETVLDGVTFEIKKGEKVGLIGRESSGKSTLMRIIAGIIRPDSGKVTVNGGVLPILDVRLGFDPALSGKDNYVAMSTVLGRSADTINSHEDSVFEFAKLSEVKDEPTRSYDKGAALRLGFTTATEIGDDIVLYDSGFAFGSRAWNKACKARLEELVSGDTTLIMTVKKVADASGLCERGIVLDNGKVAFDGAFDDAVEYYKESRRAAKKKGKLEKNDEKAAEEDIAEEEMAEEESREDEHEED